MRRSRGEQNKSLPQDFPTVWDLVAHSLHLSTPMPITLFLRSSIRPLRACLDLKSNRADLALDRDASWTYRAAITTEAAQVPDRTGTDSKSGVPTMYSC